MVVLAGTTHAEAPDGAAAEGHDCAGIERFARAKVRKVKVGGSVESGDAVISGDYDGGRFFFFCNEAHDRMRIAAPVANGADLGAAELRRLLAANFTGALDARYALSDGVVWSLFVHSPSRGSSVLGRLAPGVSEAQAKSELDAISAALAEDYPKSNRGWGLESPSFSPSWVPGSSRPADAKMKRPVHLALAVTPGTGELFVDLRQRVAAMLGAIARACRP